MATRAELAALIGQELQVTQTGDSLTPSDLTDILTRVDALRAWLIEEGLCYWPAENIPDGAKIPLAMVAADWCKAMFGVKYDRGAEGIQLLRRHCSKRATGEPAQAEYF